MDWQYVCIGIVIFFLASVIWTRSRARVHIEPLENESQNAKDALEKITRLATDVQDKVNIKTYNETYQDIVLEYDKWAGLKMIELMRDPDQLVKDVGELNKLCEFKQNLNTVMSVIDKA